MGKSITYYKISIYTIIIDNRFGNILEKKQGRKDAVLFNSGGSCNLALLQTLKNLGRLKDGDKIGFSALTWSTNVMPIIQMGMSPIPVDVKYDTLNVMSDNLKKTLSENKLAAMFITNALGFTGDLDVIRQICDEEGVIRGLWKSFFST